MWGAVQLGFAGEYLFYSQFHFAFPFSLIFLRILRVRSWREIENELELF